VCFIKHTNACGVGVSGGCSDHDRIEAYRRAYVGDPNAAMGGVLAVNFDVRPEFAEVVLDSLPRWGKAAGAGAFFVEVWIAPSFSDEAVALIRGSKREWGKRVRLLAVGDMGVEPHASELQYRSIAGGMLVQSPDVLGLNEEQWKVVTKRTPGPRELADLRLAWLICKHTKSNAITICKDGMLIGNGAGQMSRVMSCRVAVWLAQENGHLAERGATAPSDHGTMEQGEDGGGAVAASDAFFPFADGPRVLIEAGVTALIQPGGSKRDQETIDLCDSHGVAMIFTGARHFRH
jgi:phosphoribosylaminoimidazolecarboxamide formyltransferase/IMP cyclohydrolase